MSDHTYIQWTDATWNPVRGCTKISPGCAHCYAETFAERFRGVPGHPYEQGFDLRLVPEKLAEPLSWRKPRRIFVNSMSDLFHEGVPDEFIEAVFGVMAACPRHTFQVLTKRAERLPAWSAWARVAGNRFAGRDDWPLLNVHLGVSVEDQRRADGRIPHLLRTPAAVRFLSVEPLLGPIDLTRLDNGGSETYDALRAEVTTHRGHSFRTSDTRPIDWVIVGGESGPGSRPCDLAWIRSIVRQCRDAGVGCFVKQVGSKPYGEWLHGGPPPYSAGRWKLRDSKGGTTEEWPSDLRVREFPAEMPRA